MSYLAVCSVIAVLLNLAKVSAIFRNDSGELYISLKCKAKRSGLLRDVNSRDSFLSATSSLSAQQATIVLAKDKQNVVESSSQENIGIAKQLVPLYVSFLLDSVAIGVIAPILPFYIMESMEKPCNSMQLSIVMSSTYMAQTVGCMVMGMVSDRYGRKPVLSACLAASALSLCVPSVGRLLCY